jgi:hypothetical protein
LQIVRLILTSVRIRREVWIFPKSSILKITQLFRNWLSTSQVRNLRFIGTLVLYIKSCCFQILGPTHPALVIFPLRIKNNSVSETCCVHKTDDGQSPDTKCNIVTSEQFGTDLLERFIHLTLTRRCSKTALNTEHNAYILKPQSLQASKQAWYHTLWGGYFIAEYRTVQTITETSERNVVNYIHKFISKYTSNICATFDNKISHHSFIFRVIVA